MSIRANVSFAVKTSPLQLKTWNAFLNAKFKFEATKLSTICKCKSAEMGFDATWSPVKLKMFDKFCSCKNERQVAVKLILLLQNVHICCCERALCNNTLQLQFSNHGSDRLRQKRTMSVAGRWGVYEEHPGKQTDLTQHRMRTIP